MNLELPLLVNNLISLTSYTLVVSTVVYVVDSINCFQSSPVRDNEKLLKDKVNVLTAKNTETCHQLETLKQEMKLLSKVNI